MATNNATREPPQTTLYELLEYAKTRSILKNSHSNPSSANGSSSNHSSFVIRSLNSVQFNQNQSLNENSSIKSTKKIPIRISSLKRETKTAQTLRYVVVCCVSHFIFLSTILPSCRIVVKNAIEAFFFRSASPFKATSMRTEQSDST